MNEIKKSIQNLDKKVENLDEKFNNLEENLAEIQSQGEKMETLEIKSSVNQI
jgi:flagellar capping protein FliD